MRTKKEITDEAIDMYKSRQLLEVLLDIRDELVEQRKELTEEDLKVFVQGIREQLK
jgi:hypothetical protein